MMREHQVNPSAMDVHPFAQDLRRHNRTFDVPTGTALAPGRIPVRLTWLGGLPEGEVGGGAFLEGGGGGSERA
jgi:hypothetical protein